MLALPVIAEESKTEITEQDRFTDLVTFMWKHGEAESFYGHEIWTLTLEEDQCLEGTCETSTFLSFNPADSEVVLTVEKTSILEMSKIIVDTSEENGNIFIPEGSREVDHMFYTSYFIEDVGAFSPLPNIIVHSVLYLSDENMLLHMESDVIQVMEKEGHESEEWTYWIERFYGYRLNFLSRGVEI